MLHYRRYITGIFTNRGYLFNRLHQQCDPLVFSIQYEVLLLLSGDAPCTETNQFQGGMLQLNACPLRNTAPISIFETSPPGRRYSIQMCIVFLAFYDIWRIARLKYYELPRLGSKYSNIHCFQT